MAFATDELGRTVWSRKAGAHWLFAGRTRSGKSYSLSALMAQMASDPYWTPIIIDPKVTIGRRWEGRAQEICLESGPKSTQILKAVLLLARRRQERKRGSETITVGTREMPLVTLLVEELKYEFTPQLGETDKEAKERLQLLTSISAMAAESGIMLIAATQHPYADYVPGVLQGNLAQRMCLAVNEPQQIDVVLGQGMNQICPLYGIKRAPKGVGYYDMADAIDDPLAYENPRIRSWLLEDRKFPDAIHVCRDDWARIPDWDEYMRLAEGNLDLRSFGQAEASTEPAKPLKPAPSAPTRVEAPAVPGLTASMDVAMALMVLASRSTYQVANLQEADADLVKDAAIEAKANANEDLIALAQIEEAERVLLGR